MRSVVQRVRSARVEIDGESIASIGRGLLVFLGAERGDGDADLEWTVAKIAGLRIFADDDGKMSRSVVDVGGEVLVVSQFTLFGDVSRGRRPSFEAAARPEVAEPLYDQALERLRRAVPVVRAGRFRADMQVHSQVDGPVTLILDSRRRAPSD